MLRPDVAGARTDDRQKQEKPQDMTDLHAGHRIANSCPKGLFGHLALRVGESQASYPKADFTGARLRDSVPLVDLFIEHNDAVTVGEAISEITPYLFTCGPLVIALAAWVRIFQTHRLGWPGTFSFVALLVVTANAGFAAATTLYFDLSGRSTYSPPWQNKEILNLAMLFFLAPIGMPSATRQPSVVLLNG